MYTPGPASTIEFKTYAYLLNKSLLEKFLGINVYVVHMPELQKRTEEYFEGEILENWISEYLKIKKMEFCFFDNSNSHTKPKTSLVNPDKPPNSSLQPPVTASPAPQKPQAYSEQGYSPLPPPITQPNEIVLQFREKNQPPESLPEPGDYKFPNSIPLRSVDPTVNDGSAFDTPIYVDDDPQNGFEDGPQNGFEDKEYSPPPPEFSVSATSAGALPVITAVKTPAASPEKQSEAEPPAKRAKTVDNSLASDAQKLPHFRPW